MRLNIHKLLVNVLNEPAFCKQVIPRGLDNFWGIKSILRTKTLNITLALIIDTSLSGVCYVMQNLQNLSGVQGGYNIFSLQIHKNLLSLINSVFVVYFAQKLHESQSSELC